MITDPDVEAYAERHTTPAPDHLLAIDRETRDTLPTPQMLTGHIESRLLETLVWATGAGRVLEVGTFTGRGALAMAAALAPGGSVTTLEVDEQHASIARRHIDASPLADRIDLRLGPALDTLRTLEGPWDLVFIDADKTGYPAYVDAVLPQLAERGLIALDNMLRRGTVLDPDDDGSRAIAELNDRLAADPSVVVTLLPFADGLTLIRRAG